MVQQSSLFPGEHSEDQNLPRHVAIYCLPSTSDHSCERQERELTEYAGRTGFEVAEVFREMDSAAKSVSGNKTEREKVIDLAKAGSIDAVLVTELTHWGRSIRDLTQTLQRLTSWDVSLLAQRGLDFDLSTPRGRLDTELMNSLALFERDLQRERVRSGIVAAKARGKTLGRPAGSRPTDRLAPRVVKLSEASGLSQRRIARELGISKTTVNEILKRHRKTHAGS